MNRLSNYLSQNIGVETWVASLIAIALVTIVLNQVVRMLLRRVAGVTRHTATVWDDALVPTASRPLLTATWVIGLGYMARVLQRQTDEPFLTEVLAIRDVALVVCIAWFLLRFIGKVNGSARLTR